MCVGIKIGFSLFWDIGERRNNIMVYKMNKLVWGKDVLGNRLFIR